MPHVATYYFRQFDRGWTEQYYLNQGSASPANIVESLVRNTAAKAVAFRDQSTILQSVRVRDAQNLRLGALLTVDGTRQTTRSADSSPDGVVAAMRYTINGENGATRRVWFRGLDDAETKRAAANGSTISAPYTQKINAFLNAIVNAGGAIRKQIPPPQTNPLGQYDWRNVVNIGPRVGNSTWTLVYMPAGDTPPAVGSMIYFRGLANPRDLYLSGAFRVLERNEDTHTFTVGAQFRGAAAVECANTQWRPQAFTYEAIVDWDKGVLGAHATGRPISSGRGRRSPRIRRQLIRAG